MTPRAIKLAVFLATLGVHVSFGQDAPVQNQTSMPNDLVHAMAVGSKGALAVRAVQGTKGGPSVTGDEVEVVIFHRNQPVKQINAKLDDRGVVLIDDLPVSIGIRALVRIKHAGVVYQDASPQMNESNPQASMEITVNEVTDAAPPWRVKVRQLAAALVSNGIDVAETVVVENPTDATWAGEPADAQGRRATIRLTLPDDAVEVELIRGFHGWCCSAYVPPVLTVQMPLMPGETTFKFAYKIPVRAGSSSLLVSSAAPTDRALFVIPAVGVVASGQGARPGEARTVEGVETVSFESGPIQGGEVVGLALSNVQLPVVRPAVATATESKPAAGVSRLGYWVAGGAGSVVAIAVGLWALRRRGAAGA